MSTDREILSQIEALPEPRHLFVLPEWVDARTLERLIQDGHLTCRHHQRDATGQLAVVMSLELTPKGISVVRPSQDWSSLLVKGSLAGASLTLISVLILYLG